MSDRKIFRELVDLDEAIRRLYSHFKPKPIGVEYVSLENALGRVVAENIFSKTLVPPFDKSIVDGYAVRSEDTFAAGETNPVRLRIVERVRTGHQPTKFVNSGEAIEVDTGGVIPGGADAVVPVEFCEEENDYVLIYKRVFPGQNIMFAGSDIGLGELVVSAGTLLSSREIGLLAAVGLDKVPVFKKPKVAIFSIGDELVPPGKTLDRAKIYDVNSYLLYSAVIENGGDPIFLGIARDDAEDVVEKIRKGLDIADIVISSGSTSAGVSDLVYQVINKFGGPGIIVHGIKIRPGKPTVIAVIENKPYIGLPGNPTSALNVFNLIIAPLIRRIAGLSMRSELEKVKAISGTRIVGEVGRMIIQPVSLIRRGDRIIAEPILTGSGAITTLGKADGFIVIDPRQSYVEESEEILVTPISKQIQPSDIVFAGTYSPLVDSVIGDLAETHGYLVKKIKTNCVGGVRKLLSGEVDIVGAAIIDPRSGEYNRFLIKEYGLGDVAEFLEGFERKIGFVVPKGNPKGVRGFKDLLRKDILVVNQVKNSEGWAYMEYLVLKLAEEEGEDPETIKKRIRGYNFLVKDYYSAIAAVVNNRADLAVAPESLVLKDFLDFIPLGVEKYDFIVRKDSIEREAVKKFFETINLKKKTME